MKDGDKSRGITINSGSEPVRKSKRKKRRIVPSKFVEDREDNLPQRVKKKSAVKNDRTPTGLHRLPSGFYEERELPYRVKKKLK